MSTIEFEILDISEIHESIETSGSKRQIEISVFFLFLLKKVFVLAVQNFEKIATFVLKYKNIKYSKKPGTFSGFFTIPEKNKKNFRYCIDNGKLFWYSINTGRKTKKLPVFPERGVSDE